MYVMNTLVNRIIDSKKTDHVLNENQLARLLKGSAQRRYGQVNRALKSGSLIRVKRGIYVLPNSLRKKPLHPFVLAQQLMPGSYVSAESALSFHGWIPEAVTAVINISSKKKSVNYAHDHLGNFVFNCMSTQVGSLYRSVSRLKLQNKVALIAEPARALMDLVYLRKLPWQGLKFLTQGLRIDEFELRASKSSIDDLLAVYKGKREKNFIKELSRALVK